MSNHILNEDDLSSISSEIDYIETYLQREMDCLNFVIDNFESNPVVQSFYESGSFGKENQQALIRIKELYDQYLKSIKSESGLIEVTKEFVRDQLRRIEEG